MSSEKNYSPRLKTVAEEIIQVLKKHDVAGVLTLHEPGFGEFVIHLDTNYSIAKFTDEGIQIKTDKKMPKILKLKKTGDTANMFSVLAELNDMAAYQLGRISTELDARLKASHTDSSWDFEKK